MSGKNNVNPGQYKVGGRDRPDEIAKERMKSSRQQSGPPRAAKKSAKKRGGKGVG
jgi:hypothetical protein